MATDRGHPTRWQRWALVTGASSGIGLELARDLAAAGRDLVLLSRSATRLTELADQLKRAYGVQAEVIALDLAERDGPDRAVAELARRHCEIDLLVNNAGFGLYGLHANTRLDDEQQMIDLNVSALTRLTKLLLPAMLRDGRGHIVNVASTAAFQAGPYMAVYYATKAYVLSYSEALAEELRGTGVIVTALCPGPTLSGFQDKAAMQESGLIKGRRLPRARDVADYAMRAIDRRRRIAVHGAANKLMVQSLRLMPRALVTRVVAYMSRPK